MERKGIKYEFTAKLWHFTGPNGWYFISLPNILSKEIRNTLKTEQEGWGRLKAIARFRNSEWKTAIWFDSKLNTFLLPVKAEIRKKEAVEVDTVIKMVLWI